MYNESDDPSLNGFLTILFENESVISRRNFMHNLTQPKCSWVFDIEAIRERNSYFNKQYTEYKASR